MFLVRRKKSSHLYKQDFFSYTQIQAFKHNIKKIKSWGKKINS